MDLLNLLWIDIAITVSIPASIALLSTGMGIGIAALLTSALIFLDIRTYQYVKLSSLDTQ